MSTKWLKTVSASLALTVAAGTVSAETLRVVTDPSFVPFEMMDQETGEMIGFDMEIIREVADRAGFEIDLNTMDFNGIIPALQTGNVDIAIAGITITEEREEIVDFSDPYYDPGLRILVRESNGDVSEFDDLEGKKIGTKIGSTNFQAPSCCPTAIRIGQHPKARSSCRSLCQEYPSPSLYLNLCMGTIPVSP